MAVIVKEAKDKDLSPFIDNILFQHIDILFFGWYNKITLQGISRVGVVR
jgi:hypothetical protein